MTTELATRVPAQLPESVEQALIGGNLAELKPAERVKLYMEVCGSLGLNPLTVPFQYITLNGKLVLYALKSCTDQLRFIHSVNVEIVSRERLDDIYVVTTKATLPNGRTDEEIGAVPIAGLKGEALANALMKASCVPLDSEILTTQGFKRYDEVQVGDQVLAYDASTDTSVWTPLRDVTVHDDAPLVRLVSPGGQFDVLCTPDHSWAVSKPGYRPDHRTDGSRGPRGAYRSRTPDRVLVQAQAINTNQRIILAAPECETVSSVLAPVEAAILGWAVTDGTIKRVGNSVRLGISQSKTDNFDGIRELVGTIACGTKEFVSPPRTRTFPNGRTYDCLEQHWWYIPAAVSRALLEKAGFHDRTDLPHIATRLDSAARKAMLQAFMLAEGTDRGVFFNGDPFILETFQILCALEGIATGKLAPATTIFKQRLKKTRHVAGNFLRTEPAGSAPVWCPTTDYGTWVMRQNGRVMITGNTKAKRRVTLAIVGLSLLDETEIESIRDARAPLFQVSVDRETGEITEGATQAAMPPPKARDARGLPSIEELRDSWATLWNAAQRRGIHMEDFDLLSWSYQELMDNGKALKARIEAHDAGAVQ